MYNKDNLMNDIIKVKKDALVTFPQGKISVLIFDKFSKSVIKKIIDIIKKYVTIKDFFIEKTIRYNNLFDIIDEYYLILVKY